MSVITYETFQKLITEKVQKKLDEHILVKVTSVVKNNGVVLKGLCFTGEEEGISPTIYLENFYEEYKNGADLGDICDHIVDIFRIGGKNNVFDVQDFLDFEKAGKNIAFKLVNYEKNKELLKEIPHKRYLDMAVVYYYLLNNEEIENATILIYNNHLQSWGITAEELDRAAKENTPRLLEADLRSMADVLSELLTNKGIDSDFIEEECDVENVMYVLSNRTRIFGAAVILYNDVLKEFSEKVKQDLYILPSSVHEVILIPKVSGVSAEMLLEMVKEVNATQVEDIEVLSDNVYCYEREADRVVEALNAA